MKFANFESEELQMFLPSICGYLSITLRLRFLQIHLGSRTRKVVSSPLLKSWRRGVILPWIIKKHLCLLDSKLVIIWTHHFHQGNVNMVLEGSTLRDILLTQLRRHYASLWVVYMSQWDDLVLRKMVRPLTWYLTHLTSHKLSLLKYQ